jgi:alpha-L-fucosidase 2
MQMRRNLYLIITIAFSYCYHLQAQPSNDHNLIFDSVATRWDEGIPLGNGWLGALIWQKESKIRLSLDRVDLWDDRPMPEIDQLKFSWVVEQVKKGQYDIVQKTGDEPYEKYPAPTKLPGAALEFDFKGEKIISNELDIKTGLNVIEFQNGTVFNNYIHAIDQVGYFGVENFSSGEIIPELMMPGYNTGKAGTTGNSVEGMGLEKLGYGKGTVTKTANSIRYHQPTWSGNYYEVLVEWYKVPGNKLIGQWTISNNSKARLPVFNSNLDEPTGWPSHLKWWNDYWARSSVSLPDKQLEKQYYLEMYKFACVARSNTPPVSLQAIWTADNGNLPPWKGDFHHDLNTQLSYWPGYTGNHLDLTASYTNWLWKVKDENKKWTKHYFEVEGLNVPGVTTISGKAMGGWIQYSMSPTTAAWLAQHFYWQWKYSMDESFLKKKCYPYFREIELYLSAILKKGKNKNSLPLSSSPEYHDNSINAWFHDFTNYDLALVKNFYKEGEEISKTIDDKTTERWIEKQKQLPELNVNETGLTVAPGTNLAESHRHLSPYMAIYPLRILDMNKEADKATIQRSLRHIENKGTKMWCGYSFSWMACMYAQAGEGDNAVKQLQIFASNFCSPNSFHLNGDQKGGQHSSFTYRPFTLEGNFAFAKGIHEMLLQSHGGIIEIFPAAPLGWKNVSFRTLRAEGAFLVSAEKESGVVSEVTIIAEQGGTLKVKLPFKTFFLTDYQKKSKLEKGVLEMNMKKGESITIKNGYE